MTAAEMTPSVKSTMGKYDPETRTVAATYAVGDVTHSRPVNAVLKPDGSFDKAATRQRVEDVGRGVAHKVAAGLFAAPAPGAPT